jgi:hypothetical protein
MMGAMLCCALSWISSMNGVFKASRGLFVTGRDASWGLLAYVFEL